MSIILKNNAESVTTADISSLDTTIPISDTSSFPALGVGDYFYCTLESTSGTYEIVKVTQVNVSSLVAVRAQEDTIAVPFSAGARVELRITVQSIEDRLSDTVTTEITDQIGITIQAYDADLTTWAGLTPSANAQSLVTAANYAAMRTLLDLEASVDFVPITGGTFTGTITVDGGSSIPRVIIDADNNVAKILSWRTDNVARWAIRVDGNETGSNVGSDWYLRRYTDAGAFIDAPMTVTRSTGAIAFNSVPTASGNALLTTANIGSTVQAYDADTAKTDAANVFSATQRISQTQPTFQLQETDGPADEKVWQTRTNTGNHVRSALSDVFAGETIFELIQRTGTTIDEIQWDATLFDMNGNLDLSGVLLLAAGSAAAPSLAGSGDPDTGIELPGSNVAYLVAGGARQVRWSSALFAPVANDGVSLGSSSLGWSDFSLASGAVIRFANTDYTITHSAGALAFSGAISASTVKADVPISSETSGTLTAASANKEIRATGNITIPASVFASPNKIRIYAGASARTLTQGGGGTQRLGGTTTTGNLTLAVRGWALVEVISATEWTISGDVS